MISFEESYAALRDGAVSNPLDDFGLIELSGDDRLEWLQGQATNDVSNIVPGSRIQFCFCEPTGQILAPVDAWALPDRILMTVPKPLVNPVLERIERMTILEDVAARSLSEELAGVALYGAGASTLAAGLDDASTLVLSSNRIAYVGFDVWGRKDDVPDLAPAANPLALEAARIEAGTPKWGADFGPRTLPAEMGPAFEAAHVSYAKGCYTGQEVLMRMHARGHTNRTWVGLVASEPLAVGAEVVHEGRPVGAITSSTPSLRFGAVAAATLRNEAVAEGTRAVVHGVEAEVRTMPILRAG